MADSDPSRELSAAVNGIAQLIISFTNPNTSHVRVLAVQRIDAWIAAL